MLFHAFIRKKVYLVNFNNIKYFKIWNLRNSLFHSTLSCNRSNNVHQYFCTLYLHLHSCHCNYCRICPQMNRLYNININLKDMLNKKNPTKKNAKRYTIYQMYLKKINIFNTTLRQFSIFHSVTFGIINSKQIRFQSK
jgi:hypothetical protein